MADRGAVPLGALGAKGRRVADSAALVKLPGVVQSRFRRAVEARSSFGPLGYAFHRLAARGLSWRGLGCTRAPWKIHRAYGLEHDMRAITSTCTLLVFLSIMVVASACSGDAGSLGADVPASTEATGVNADAPATDTVESEACEEGAEPRCAEDGGIQLCTDGVWQPSLACAEGEVCEEGTCVAACKASCEGKLCGDDGCGGLCGTCPATETCNDAGQCEASACEASCEGKTCGDDGCGGVCGLCADGEACVNGACEVAVPEEGCGGVSFEGCCDGSMLKYCENDEVKEIDCSAGSGACGWNAEGGYYDCGTEGDADPSGANPQICEGGSACEPSCEGVTCGNDGCGGTCGTCAEGEACLEGACVVSACGDGQIEGCEGECISATWYGDGYCDTALNCEALEYDGGDCPLPCAEGEVYDCNDACVDAALVGDGTCQENLQCQGSEWDGGDCEPSCDEGQVLSCNDTCVLESWLGDGYCDPPLNCEAFSYDSGDCPLPCAEGEINDCTGACVDESLLGDGTCQESLQCEDKEWDGGDCEPVCPEGQIVNCEQGCTNGSWLGDNFCDTKLDCEALEYDAGDCAAAECGDGECSGDETEATCPEDCAACEPSCGDAVCGDDGCGGSCGECEEGSWCNAGSCDEGPCVPACGDAACGDDGCGGSCGECAEGEVCDAGACGPAPCEPSCGDAVCGDDGCGGLCGKCEEGESCADGACITDVCTPDCDAAACGDDGCGGSCGACAEGEVCNAGACEAAPCEPACGDSVCGDDGCGGSCGECAEGATCEAGACIDEPVGGDATCEAILTCEGECDPEDAACIDACVATGSEASIEAYTAYDACWDGCEDWGCVLDNCAGVATDCLWPGVGELACMDVNDCIGACEDAECTESCLASGSESAQSIWMQILWCRNLICGAEETPEAADACWATASGPDGACSPYVVACFDDGDGATVVPVDPEPEGTCTDIVTCAETCEEGDTVCTDACIATGSEAAGQSYSAWAACLADCDGDGDCVVETCAPDGAQCLWPGEGDVTCADVNDCLGACDFDADPTCGDACFASGDAAAKALWLQLIWCNQSVCGAIEDEAEANICWAEATSDGGACFDYIDACGLAGEDPISVDDGVNCSEINECVSTCEEDAECEAACVEQGSEQSVEDYTEWMACFDDCDDYSCLQDECAAEGSTCFWPGEGSASCAEVNACLGECDGDSECSDACFASGTSDAKALWTQILWCSVEQCGDAAPGDDFAACWATATSADGECGGYIAACFPISDEGVEP